jgi:opacity protein-like surface antigen
MFSLFSSARATALSVIACAFLSFAAQAADMPFPSPLSPPANDGPIEWGTGWYLRGDIGAAQSSLTTTDGIVLPQSFPNNWTAGLGGGYQYNNWLRTDVTVDYEQLYNKSGPQYVITPCQIGAVGTPAGGPFTNSIPVYAGCSPNVQSRAETMAVLANAYLDLGNWGGFTPYVGAGAGVNVMYQKSQVTWYEQNLVAYAGTTWTDPYTLGTYMANWDRAFSGTSLRFAYAFMGGVSYDLTDHVKIDLGYRWLNLGHFTSHDLYGGAHTKDIHVNQVRLGFRYTID